VGWYDFKMVRREITLPWRWVSTCRVEKANHTDVQGRQPPQGHATACVLYECILQRISADKQSRPCKRCCGACKHLALLVYQDVLAANPGHGLAVRHLVSRHRRQRACTGLPQLSVHTVIGTGGTLYHSAKA